MTTEVKSRWRSTRAEAEAVRECANSHKVSTRAVRDWRRANDPRWQRFLANRAGNRLGQLEAAALRVDLENSSPEDEERAALRRFRLLENEISAALDRGELISVPAITRAAADSHKLLQQTREATIAWKKARRELIPVGELRELIERYVLPIKSIIEHIPEDCADSCNPNDPQLAAAVLRQWLAGKFTEYLHELRDAIPQAKSSENE